MKCFVKNKSIASFLFLIFCTLSNGQVINNNISFKPVDLQTDYLEAPIGVDNSNPRLTWSIEDSRQGTKQTAYRLIVGTDGEKVGDISGNTHVSGSLSGISWDTGVVRSNNQLVSYAGANLEPFTKYY